MKPLQLYLIFNVVFFLLLYKSADMFNVDFNYIDDNPYGEQAMALAKQKISKSAISYKTFAGLYDDKAAAYGKLFLPAFIPLMGLVSYLLFFKRIKQFVPHLVFSTHLFTFIIFLFLLFICGVAKPLYSTQFFNEYRSFLWKIVFMIIGVYMAFANKTVYKESWLLTIPKSIVMMIAFVFILAAYRTAITFITLYKM